MAGVRARTRRVAVRKAEEGIMISFESKTEKRSLMATAASLGLVIVILVFALFYLIFGHTLGWFASNDSVEADGLQVVVKTPGYDLLVDRGGARYNVPQVDGEDVYEGFTLFKNMLEGAPFHYDFTAADTSVAPKLAFEIYNESEFRDEDGVWYYMMPGAYGKMTFYIRPYHDENMVMNMELDLAAFGVTYDANNVPVMNEVTSEGIRDLLRGHIMFFTERTGNTYADYKYDGLLSDHGIFTFDTTGQAKSTKPGRTDCYEITLYWEWPLTYYDIIEDISVSADENNNTPAVINRFPVEVGEFITDSPGCFFLTNQNSTDPDELSDGYNDGDQAIGENASFFAAFITPVL